MGLAHSPSIATNGLVFYYDMNNPQKSWKGAPTTNLVNPNWASWSVDGSGQGSIGTRTITDSFTCTIVDEVANTRQNAYIDSGITASTTYTFSVQYKKLFGTPTLRFQIQAYNGSTYLSTMSFATTAQLGLADIEGWQTAKITLTTPASTNRILWFMQDGDDYTTYTHRFMLANVQCEQQAFATPFVAGTRSNTQAILDLTNNNTITATSLTYVSDSTFSFNGSSGNITSSSFTGHQTISGTIMGWAYPTSTSGDLYLVAAGGTNTYGASRAIRINSGSWCAVNYGSSTEDWNGIVGAIINTWQHIAYVWSGTTIRFYFNGVEYTNTRSGMVIPLGSVLTIGATAWSPVYGYFPGKINSIQAYSRALSSPEVLQNFNAQRGIYGI